MGRPPAESVKCPHDRPLSPAAVGIDNPDMTHPPCLDTCNVCGALIPEGHAVFTMRDALAGPVVVMCRNCAALDEHIEDAVESDDPDAANP